MHALFCFIIDLHNFIPLALFFCCQIKCDVMIQRMEARSALVASGILPTKDYFRVTHNPVLSFVCFTL